MRFMMLIKADHRTEAGEMPSTAVIEAMTRFNQELIAAGALLGGEGLAASSKGARVFLERGHKRRVVDGPFTEAKELVAGFWIIQCASLAEAIEWAKRVPDDPTAPDGAVGQIEIRQIFELTDFPAEAQAAAAPEIAARAELERRKQS